MWQVTDSLRLVSMDIKFLHLRRSLSWSCGVRCPTLGSLSLFPDLSLWPWRALYRTPRRHGEDVANWIVYITVAVQYIARRSGNPTKQGTWISARLSYAGAGLTDHAGFVCTNEATRCRSEYFTLLLSISLINIAIFSLFLSLFLFFFVFSVSASGGCERDTFHIVGSLAKLCRRSFRWETATETRFTSRCLVSTNESSDLEGG